MAGHIITRYLETLNKYEIINASRSKLNERTKLVDAENQDSLKNLLVEQKPNYIINCLGVLVKASTDHPDLAIYINSYLPYYLSELGNRLKYKLIHLSTDCVFSGDKGDYSESDHKDGRDMYARTKALGEVVNHKDLTFRTSIIGPELKKEGTGLFHWFMTQKSTISGYKRVLWTGVTTLELAKAISKAIDENLSSLYHLVPDTKISKYDLLCLLKEIWGKNVQILKDEKIKQDKSLINHRTDFTFKVKNHREMLEELHVWMKNWDYPYYK